MFAEAAKPLWRTSLPSGIVVQGGGSPPRGEPECPFLLSSRYTAALAADTFLAEPDASQYCTAATLLAGHSAGEGGEGWFGVRLLHRPN